ncbi:MAG: CopG family transcriptional regulator [Planctomycetes bacterium]|nr:CopG family transcriptional regulator [Planctomycetota bacterium]
MVRTQVYLTEEERTGLSALVESTGKKQAQLIREAVDRLIDMASESRCDSVLRNAAGMWQNRSDLPNFSATRQSWDRS